MVKVKMLVCVKQPCNLKNLKLPHHAYKLHKALVIHKSTRQDSSKPPWHEMNASGDSLLKDFSNWEN